MNEVSIIYEGLTLMCLGMGFVCFFLLLMIGAIRVLTNVAAKIQPTPELAPATQPAQTTVAQDDSIVAAIAAALHHHKQKQCVSN